MSKKPSPADATWIEHHNMQFWLWACIENANRMIKGHLSEPPSSDWRIWASENRLARYNFLTSIGSLIRNLDRAQYLFPEIRDAYLAAAHLHSEGRKIRNLFEHSEEYFIGRGKFQNEWYREDVVGGGTADASSVVIMGEEIWLGGRLHVQKVVAEILPIEAIARSIKAPKSPFSPILP